MELSGITLIALIIFAIIVVNGLFFLFIVRKLNADSKKAEEAKQNDQSYLLLQNQLQDLTQSVHNQLSESRKQMSDSTHQIHETVRAQLGESGRVIKEVTEGLTKLDETNKQVISFADQLQSLQDVLKNPKQRGVLGEYYLETVLKNVLPPDVYQMQYTFEGGEIVDAVVFVKDKVVPIDSKFSLENYNRIIEEKHDAERARLEKLFVNDLKERVKETSKYIRPKDNTTEFAFMFIPHEAIYYDLLTNKIGTGAGEENIIQRAASAYKVIVVSPTSFLAYLQTVLQGLRAMQIEESAKEIRKNVEQLGKHLGKYEEFHTKLGNALGTTINMYNSTTKELKKIDKDVLRVTGENAGIEPPLLEKPAKEDE